MLNGHELLRKDFYSGTEQPGVFLEKDAFKNMCKSSKLNLGQKAECEKIVCFDYL